MRYFAVYDAASGVMKRTGFCSSDADLPIQARAGEAVIATATLYDAAKFRVDLTKKPPMMAALTS